MKKLNFKNVFSKAFVVSLAAIAVSGMDVDALTIRENVNTDIVEGSYIIGISKFTPEQILTGVRVSKATINDMVFNRNIADYAGSDIYYYDFGDWYILDENNNTTLVNDQTTIDKLNSRDVYYVNNVEKPVTITYTKEVREGYELNFVTDNGKKVTYNADKGTIDIPATVNNVTVYQRPVGTTGNGTKLDSFTKNVTSVKNGTFEFVNKSLSEGTISMDGEFTKTDATVSGNNIINVNGTIGWHASTETSGTSFTGENVAGYKVGVKIAAPSGMAEATRDAATIEIYENGKKTRPTFTWGSSDAVKVKGALWLTPVVESGKTYTVKITWTQDSVQTFTINVNGTYAAKPAGTIAGKTIKEVNEKGEEVGDRLTATASGETLTFAGKSIDWDGKVEVELIPNKEYSDSNTFNISEAAASVTAKYKKLNPDYDPDDETSERYLLVDATDGAADPKDGKIVQKLKFTEETADSFGRNVVVTVTWGEGYTQEFNIVLASSTKFVFPQFLDNKVNTISGYAADGTASEYTYVFAEDKSTNTYTANVTGTVVWSTNTEKPGNRISTVISADTTTTGNLYTDAQLSNMTLRLNGETITYKDGKDADGNDIIKNVTFGSTVNDVMEDGEFNWEFAAENNKSYRLEIVYGSTVVRTYVININNADLSRPQDGTIAAGTNFAVNSMSGDVRYVSGSVYNETDKKYNAFPFTPALNSNTVPMVITNNVYAANYANTEVEQVVDGETYTTKLDASGNVDVVVKANKTTVVKVKWDNMNVQTFYIAPTADRAQYAAAVKGVVTSATTGWTEDRTGEDADKTSLTFKETVPFVGKVEAANAKIDTGVTGNRLNITITPDASVVSNITAAPSVTISGGKYVADKDGKLPEVGAAVYDNNAAKTLTLDPIVTEKNQTFTITVKWFGNYVETYTVRVNAKELATDGRSVVLGTTTLVEGTNNLTENIPYVEAQKENALIAKLTATDGVKPEKIEIEDARTVVKTVNGKEVKQNEVIETAEITLDSNNTFTFPVHFTKETKEVRTAKITVTWEEGNVKTYVINAGNVDIISIKPSDMLTYNKDEKYYELNAVIGDEIRFVESTAPTALLNSLDITPSDTLAFTSDSGKDIYTTTNTANVYRASVAGKSVVTITGKDAKPLVVHLNVTYAPVTFDANVVSTDASTVRVVVSNVKGGYGQDGYTVTVTPYYYNVDTGMYAPVVGADGEAQLVDGSYVRTYDINKNFNYNYVVTVTDNKIDNAADSTVKAVKDLEVTKEAEYANNITHTVTFDSNGGSAVASQDIKPMAGVYAKKPEDPTKANFVSDATGKEYRYEFAGWFLASDVDLAMNQKLVVTGNATDGYDVKVQTGDDAAGAETLTAYNFNTDVTEDITLVAVWSDRIEVVKED